MRMVSFPDSRNSNDTTYIVVVLYIMHCFVLIYTICVALPDDFPESTGVKRIVQALNANVWSSVEMKDGEMTSLIKLLIAFAPI